MFDIRYRVPFYSFIYWHCIDSEPYLLKRLFIFSTNYFVYLPKLYKVNTKIVTYINIRISFTKFNFLFHCSVYYNSMTAHNFIKNTEIESSTPGFLFKTVFPILALLSFSTNFRSTYIWSKDSLGFDSSVEPVDQYEKYSHDKVTKYFNREYGYLSIYFLVIFQQLLF